MTRIFITGGSSAIGQCVISRLIASGCNVTALTHRHFLPGGLPVKTVAGSILEPESYKAAVRDAEVVLHLAGLSHSDIPKQYDEVNTEGARCLLGVCAPTAFFVYMSTRCAHLDGGDYAVSKLLAEQAVVSSGLRYAIVRPAEIYGTKANEGIDRMLDFALCYHVVLDFRQHGVAASYAPISAYEVAEFLVKVAVQPLRDKAVYTICAERSWTANDICRELARSRRCRYFVLPIPIRLLEVLLKMRIPMPFKRDQIARLIVSKSNDLSAARMDYGFNPLPFTEYIHTLL
jgi:nucleoside-diphosphate-sugar epimerase